MIINTGCRTDIPAFYSKWLINRIEEGYVLVRNPYNSSQVTRYNLNPDVVDCIEFCTKNPKPMLKYLDKIDKYRQYWFVTITPYGKNIEPNVPRKEEVIESFKKLSKHVGINSISWRYDPIFIGEGFDVEKHIYEFQKMSSELKGYTNSCTISFLDLYEKVKRNAKGLKPPTREEEIKIAKAFSRIGKENDMVIHGCCENDFLIEYGIDCDGCMSQKILEKSIGSKIKLPSGRTIRKQCNCILGNDIGAYDTCMHLCKYCYANTDAMLVKENVKKHDDNSPFLIGEKRIDDKITQAKQKSWIVENEQLSFI